MGRRPRNRTDMMHDRAPCPDDTGDRADAGKTGSEPPFLSRVET
ncbi:hypothetical protein Y88_2211 [Novosphingobium nitrogenifigens DSM 19370]|uniref:Uncharacterized protein n=1 Tax=Novosphingobium nitrogenifigens DSM 19370 TaxID=983920 RepID=F1Z5F8_9SPHN|nr:hypothetical protein Y88_2211 [Novosphingobium nitrogenifigens DSM 19370]